jgi:hypothetical protein
MIINKDNIWMHWPETLSEKLDKGSLNELYSGKRDFTIYVEIDTLKKYDYMQPIFSILPNFLSVDFKTHNKHQGGTIIHFTITTNKNIYYIEEIIDYSEKYSICYYFKKDENKINCTVNGKGVLNFVFKEDENLIETNNFHLILGAQFFPKNNREHINSEFNINKMFISEKVIEHYEIDDLDCFPRTLKKYNILAYFDFIEKTEYKIFDHSENNNHLHLIV